MLLPEAEGLRDGLLPVSDESWVVPREPVDVGGEAWCQGRQVVGDHDDRSARLRPAADHGPDSPGASVLGEEHRPRANLVVTRRWEYRVLAVGLDPLTAQGEQNERFVGGKRHVDRACQLDSSAPSDLDPLPGKGCPDGTTPGVSGGQENRESPIRRARATGLR